MTSQSSQCPRCGTANVPDASFCFRCGSRLVQQAPPTPTPPTAANNTKALWITVGVLVAVFGSCGLCGIIGKLSDKTATQTSSNSANASNANTSQVAAPTATPQPSFADLQQRGQSLLSMNKEEYVEDDLKAFDAVIGPLRAIPKDAKEYGPAQALIKKLVEKAARITAEILVLGPKPTNSAYDGRVDPVVEYLKNNLNDYDSSEFVEWSAVTKLEVKGEPFWVVRLKLRAKNAFGGYILRNTFYFLRQNKVVSTEGL